MRIAGALLILGALSGCASQFVEPTAGPTAQVRFQLLDDNYFALIHTYDTLDCQGPQPIGLIGSKRWVTRATRVRPGMIDSAEPPDTRRLEVLVPAGRPVVSTYGQLGPNDPVYVRTCRLATTFVPEPDRQYVLRYRYDKAKCYVSVQELGLDAAGGVRLTPVAAMASAETCTK